MGDINVDSSLQVSDLFRRNVKLRAKQGNINTKASVLRLEAPAFEGRELKREDAGESCFVRESHDANGQTE
jgi:hypothetical protein